ncbi:MAG: MFS transporter [Novosphingobium sp.]|nr:MFS transporter [Novosphingobium sp.]
MGCAKENHSLQASAQGRTYKIGQERRQTVRQWEDSVKIDKAQERGAVARAGAVPAFRAWSSVGILLVLALVSMLDRQIISLLVDPIKADLNLSDTEISLLQGLAFSLFYSTAAIPLGWAVDRYPRKIVCYFGVTVWSLGASACGLATNFWQLFLARITVGAGEASLNPASVSLISDIFPREKVGSAMGVYGSAVSLGSGLALIIGGLIIEFFAGQDRILFPLVGEISAWQAVFLATGLPGVAIAFLAFLLTDPRPRRTKNTPAEKVEDGFAAYMRVNGRLIVLLLAGFSFAAFNFYAIGSWTPAYLGRTFGLKADEIGWAWGLIVMISGATGAIAGGLLIDRAYRAGIHDATIAVPAFAALAAWPVLTIAYQLPGPVPVLAALGIGTLLIGIVAAGSLAVWQRVAPPQLRGRMSAIFGLVSTGTGATLGPIMPALVTDHVFADEAMVGWSLSIVMGVALPLLALCLLGARRVLAATPELAIPGEAPAAA